MLNQIFNTSTEEEKKEAVEKLIVQGSPDTDFFLMVALSVLMAAFGLLINSVAIIIGAMLIAPVLSPILSTGMGVVMSKRNLIRRSIFTIGKSILVALGAAFLVGLFFGTKEALLGEEIISRVAPSLPDVAIAVIAGFAASFAIVKKKLNETIPGIAISVSLIPPLAVAGLGLAFFDFSVVRGAFLLFFVNILGIIFASIFVFSLMNLYVKRGTAERALEKEDKRMEKEKIEAEKNNE